MGEEITDEEWRRIFQDAQEKREWNSVRQFADQVGFDRGVVAVAVDMGDPNLVRALTADPFDGWMAASEIIKRYEYGSQALALLDAIEALNVNESLTIPLDDDPPVYTLLGVAAALGRWRYFQWLVDYGADLAVEYYEALRKAKSARAVAELLRLGALPNVLGQATSSLLSYSRSPWPLLSLPDAIRVRLRFVAEGHGAEKWDQIREALGQHVGQNLIRYLRAAL